MRRRPLALALVALATLLGPAMAAATMVVPLAETDLIDHARAIVIGRVTAIESRWDSDSRTISTHIALDVEEVIKGRIAPGPITIRQLGGRVNGVQLWLEGSPEFATGERVLVFLRIDRDGTARVMHLYQGKFTIETDPDTSEETAVRRPGRGVHVLRPPGAPLAGHAAPVERHRLEDFKRRIRSRVAVGAGAPAATVEELATASPVTSQFTFLGDVPARWTEPDSGQFVPMLMNGDGDPTAPGLGFGSVRDAYAAWSSVAGSSFRYTDAGFTTAAGFALDGVNAVSFRDPRGQIDPPINCAGTLALGGFWRDETQSSVVNGQTFVRIVEGDVVFADGWDGCGVFAVSTNLAEIATHELGHVLGLGHSTDPDATMYATAHLDGRGASLRSDDRAGVAALYPPRGAKLTVVIGGGAGVVTSSPPGISCGSDCSETYPAGSTVTLTATPAAGATFGGWSGGCGGTGACTVTLAADTTVTATFRAPLTVRVTSPAAGATVAGAVTVAMAASGGSGTGYVYRFAVDGAAAFAGTSPSFGWNTTTVANGAHVLSATVTDSAGGSATASLTVTVANPTASALKVSITGPPAGATVIGVSWVDVWVEGATGTANVFTISVAGATAGSQTSSGTHVTIPWDTRTVADGPQTLTATVKDATGKSGSASIGVTVKNGATTPPPLAAGFTSPAAGATVSGVVTVGMSATGASGAVTFVLNVDGGQVFSQTVAGTAVSYAWNTAGLANGAHALAVTVTDGGGRSATATRGVTVNNPAPPPGGTLKIAFTSPAANATVSGVVWVDIWVEGASGTANTFTLSVAGSVVRTETSAGVHVTIAWDTTLTPDGPQTLSATVRDATGASGTGTLAVAVRNGTTPPPPPALVASFTGPANGATVSGTVKVGMAASGVSGGAATFELAVDGGTVSTQTGTTTASYDWNSVGSANGGHTLTLTVTDAAGRRATAALTVTVSNATPPPVTLKVFITSPAAGATISGVVWVDIWVEDASGAANTFTLSVGGATVHSETSSGVHVTVPWDTRTDPNGQQTMTATVTDAAGASGSTTRSVAVAN